MLADEKDKEELESDVIVIDCGSGTVKAGWAGEDHPRCAVPTLVLNAGSASSAAQDATPDANDVLVGHDAQQELHANPSLHDAVSYPIVRGEIVDLEGMTQIWEHIFKEELRVDPTQYPVLLTCPPLSSKASREAMAKIMFRHFKVPSLTICNQAPLCLFSTGRTTGIVVEIGEGVTHAVPIFEGFALDHAILRLPLAGADLTRHLMKILKARGINFTESHFDVVRDIKEKLCAVKLPGDLDQVSPSPDEMTYELPDGQIIQIDDECRYKTTEILFQPDIFSTIEERDHNRASGVHRICYDSIMMCDSYLQKDLFKNIVLAGGSSMLQYFGERMRKEMAALGEGYQYTSVVTDSQRKYAAWIGGSMYASLGTFSQIKITQAEYVGDPHIVHKKFF